MSTPAISIIIPCYNHAQEISKCLDSILAQTFRDFEIIVVNDGSTDNLARILEKYQDKVIIVNQENQGANVARNNGFKISQGQFVIFCDADLILVPEALEKMLKILKNRPEKSYVYCSFYFGWKKFSLGEFVPERLKNLNYIHTSSLIRREHFPGFDPAIKKFQDWDLWLTMLAQGYTGSWISEYLFRLKPRKNGLSQWLPKFFYKIPWRRFGFKIKAVEDYIKAAEIIKQKHHL